MSYNDNHVTLKVKVTARIYLRLNILKIGQDIGSTSIEHILKIA